MITGLAVIMAVYVALAVAGSPALFFALLFVMGLSVGILEVAVNLEADRVEYGLKQRIMNRALHSGHWGFRHRPVRGRDVQQRVCSGSLPVLVWQWWW